MPSSLKILSVVCIVLLASLKSFAQSDTSIDKKWAAILAQYNSGILNDTAYMNEAQSLVDLSIKDLNLKQNLSTYKKIAWSDPSYQRRRLRYYLMLYNNAVYNYKSGASFYYVEKAEEERKKIQPYVNSLHSLIAVIYNYGRTKSGYARCIDEYNKELPFLKQLPQKIATDSVPVITLINATASLTDIADFYSQLKDTANALVACSLSENIWNSIQNKKQYGDSLLLRTHYNYYLAQYFKQKILHQFSAAKNILDTALAIVNSKHTGGDYIWWQAVPSDMYLNYFNFFIEQKKTDSAAYYLNLIKKRQDISFANLGDGTAYLFNYAELKASEGDYKTAYQNLQKAYDINDSVIGIKTADINNNMYAQTLAEDKEDALKKAASLQHKRNILIIVISAISLISIVLLYLQMRKKDKEAKDRIYKLNYASQLQIMELEERNFSIKQDEQRKLGMDLHDDLAGTIAAIKIKVETEIINNENPLQAERLKNINNLINDVYERTRNKSHELYNGLESEPGIPFSKRIKLLTDNSFASGKYKITIDVEDGFMKSISLDIKIQLLYIIQEAVTNIIKHSSASNISILVYEDINELALYIADDGKGFANSENKKGIGLKSIRERAAAVNGTVKITSGSNGTEITVSIPFVQDNPA